MRPQAFSFVCLQTADKATLEVFELPQSEDLTTAVISRHSNPASEIGGDARLLMPGKDRVQVQDEDIDGQVSASWSGVFNHLLLGPASGAC